MRMRDQNSKPYGEYDAFVPIGLKQTYSYADYLLAACANGFQRLGNCLPGQQQRCCPVYARLRINWKVANSDIGIDC